MKVILEELKKSMGGIIGSFVIGEGGVLEAQDVPEVMHGHTETVSRTIYHTIHAMEEAKSVERMTVDSENAKLVVLPADGRLLVVIGEKNLNLPLFKLISSMIVSKIREEPVAEARAVAEEKPAPQPAPDAERICRLYDGMFEIAAKKLLLILGPGAGRLFAEKAGGVMRKYGALFEGVGFGRDGKPEIEKILKNAAGVSREELIEGLEGLLEAMLEGVMATAGARVADKARVEINTIKEENKEVWHG